MVEVFDKIWVGSLDDFIGSSKKDFAFVHATKSLFDNSLGEVIYEIDNHLYLNWVDSKEEKYFDYKGLGVSVFVSILNFIEKWHKSGSVLIHCNEGLSRSPSIAMVYLAKRLKVIDGKDHVFAEREFSDIYPEYYANKGISDFLFKNWFKIK